MSVYRVAYNGIPSKNVFNTSASGFKGYIVQEVNAAGFTKPLTAAEE
jgi:hypothetical protein